MAKLGIVLPIKKLQQLSLAEETELIGFDVYYEIKSVVNFLMDLEKKILTMARDRVKEIEEPVNEIEDLVYRIEDVLQSYGVFARSTSSSSPFKYLKRYSDAKRKQAENSITVCCDKINQFARKLSESRYDDVQGYSSFDYESSRSWHDDNNRLLRQNSRPLFVGLKKETDLIVQVLLKDTNELDFLAIAIWGRSGTGKDVLAREVCSHSRILEKFKSIEIRVSENMHVPNALLYVLEQFTEGCVDQYKSDSTDTLKGRVRKHLENSRTLIFLQGVRSIDDWQRLHSVLGVKGCRILFTTQARQVAEGIITQSIYIHEKMPLTEDDSWELLEKIVSLEINSGAKIEPAKETMGKEMVKLSEGIPGAIITLAKELAGKSVNEWEIVQKNARHYLSQVMAPSFDDLSVDQKLYFLYLGLFREDEEIEPEKLCHLWAIEGLISSQDCESEMKFLELTQELLMVLAKKQMIEVRQIIEVKSCRLVGLMGDMCLSKAEETGFLKVVDLQISNQPLFSSSKTRRLVVYLGKYDTRVTPELAPNLGSLRIIMRPPVHDQEQPDQEFVWPSIMSNIKKLKTLRILDFRRVDFRRGKLSGGIFALPFLRYLSFEGCFLEKLPSSISNLSYLEVLDLRINNDCSIIVPDVLRRMKRLQHLYLPRAFQTQNGGKLRLDGLVELQTLNNFNSELCEIGDLFKLTKLRDLVAKVEESVEDLKSITERMIKTDGHKWLHSSIEVKNFDCYTEEKHKVFRQLLESGVPPILSFEGRIDLLPPHSRISQNFTEIVFSSTQLKEDPMAMLENLTQLRLLVLDDEAFLGEKMVCSAFGFPELKHLQLSSLFFFNEWRVENAAMPRLSHLKIYNCEKLETLPHGSSRFLDSLVEFKTRNMSKQFVDTIQNRYGKLKHPPSLVLDD